MSLVKSTSISVDEGEETGSRWIFKHGDNWDMGCVRVPFKRWMGKTKYLSAFERGMVVGAGCTGLHQELQRYWVFHNQQFPVCIKNGPPPKGHPANLTQLWEASESTWASIPVGCFRHLVESMSDELRLSWEQNGVQLNIRKMFLMFGLEIGRAHVWTPVTV